MLNPSYRVTVPTWRSHIIYESNLLRLRALFRSGVGRELVGHEMMGALGTTLKGHLAHDVAFALAIKYIDLHRGYSFHRNLDVDISSSNSAAGSRRPDFISEDLGRNAVLVEAKGRGPKLRLRQGRKHSIVTEIYEQLTGGTWHQDPKVVSLFGCISCRIRVNKSVKLFVLEFADFPHKCTQSPNVSAAAQTNASDRPSHVPQQGDDGELDEPVSGSLRDRRSYAFYASFVNLLSANSLRVIQTNGMRVVNLDNAGATVGLRDEIFELVENRQANNIAGIAADIERVNREFFLDPDPAYRDGTYFELNWLED